MKNLYFFLAISCSILFSNQSFCQWKQTSGASGSQVRCVAINGANIFAGTRGAGVFLSSDNGENWSAKNNGLTNANFWSLAINENNIFAGSDSEAGIFLSTDIGENWRAVNNGLTLYNIFSIAISSTNIFASPAASGVFLSTNNGESWIAVNDGLTYYQGSDSTGIDSSYVNIYSIAISGENIFVGGGDGLFLSTNNGVKWNKLTNAPPYVEKIVINEENIFAGTELGMFISKDNGGSWTEISNGLINKDVRAITISGEYIFAGTQGGGVFISTNNGSNWTAFNTGLTQNKVWSLAISGGNVFAGTDNGVWKYNFLPPIPICYVEFDTATSKNSINWSSNLSSKFDSVHIYTEVSTEVWEKIGSVGSGKSNFIDMNSNPFNQSYSYKISVKDASGFEMELSESHTTITLLATYNSGTNVYGFTWSAYEGLPIANYYLYGVKQNGTDSLIGTLPGNKYFYNYTNPYPGFVNYYVGFYAPTCTSKSNHLVKSNYGINTTGITELTIDNKELRIYPNPANQQITINYQLPENNPVNITIYDITGRKVEEKINNNQSKGEQKININTQQLDDGIYILNLYTKDFTANHKIVVKH